MWILLNLWSERVRSSEYLYPAEAGVVTLESPPQAVMERSSVPSVRPVGWCLSGPCGMTRRAVRKTEPVRGCCVVLCGSRGGDRR